ncbi:hypothetical protein GUJ93_ZPchr0002g23386 [Zizania palustris]|uniref:Uncharacterized protein n=1 Tax=Zizania palustris TaxID=103762 RepID=A0A8J5VTR8_ZIZPA|nr:hypothetical protein GUJ93_ZPchr0002g23386 [Zizania palustris]
MLTAEGYNSALLVQALLQSLIHNYSKFAAQLSYKMCKISNQQRLLLRIGSVLNLQAEYGGGHAEKDGGAEKRRRPSRRRAAKAEKDGEEASRRNGGGLRRGRRGNQAEMLLLRADDEVARRIWRIWRICGEAEKRRWAPPGEADVCKAWGIIEKKLSHA